MKYKYKIKWVHIDIKWMHNKRNIYRYKLNKIKNFVQIDVKKDKYIVALLWFVSKKK